MTSFTGKHADAARDGIRERTETALGELRARYPEARLHRFAGRKTPREISGRPDAGRPRPTTRGPIPAWRDPARAGYVGRLSSVTSTVRLVPDREYASVMLSPGRLASIAAREVVGRRHPLAVDRGDDVAAGRVLLAADRLPRPVAAWSPASAAGVP